MREFFFVLKTFIFTLILVLLLQIKLGENTIEHRALAGLRESEAALSLQELGVDGFMAFRKIAAQATSSVSEFFGTKNKREKYFDFGRSKAYLEEQAQNKSAAKED